MLLHCSSAEPAQFTVTWSCRPVRTARKVTVVMSHGHDPPLFGHGFHPFPDWLVWTIHGPGSGEITSYTMTSLGVLLPPTRTTGQGLSRAADGRYDRKDSERARRMLLDRYDLVTRSGS